MSHLVVVYKPRNWPFQLPNVEVVSARDYLTNASYSQRKNIKVYNLSRSYRYQSLGYYVSLLAAARGHAPIPSVLTIQDLKSQSIIRGISDDLDALIQKNLADLKTPEFTLSIYFGRNVAKKYDRLSRQLFNLFPAPLLRAYFVYHQRWEMQNIEAISTGDIPEHHLGFVHEAAIEHFSKKNVFIPKRIQTGYDLAILHNPDEKTPPSNERALQKFLKAATSIGLNAELITREDAGRLLEFDGLFIRETTSVHHHTYRLARKAEAEGLAVIDDPNSILRCTNKVYLAELLQRYGVPTPQTIIMHKKNMEQVLHQLGLPCILKQPDSSFSQGVVKADSPEEFRQQAAELLDKSDLVIAQAFTPTPFDWRVGILDQQPLYVCKYYMAKKHWQIYKHDGKGHVQEGESATLPVNDAPKRIVRTALKAANLIGNGLYGVDLKEIDGQPSVIEVNDNPSIDADVEDKVLNDMLYRLIMETFLRRIEQSKRGGSK